MRKPYRTALPCPARPCLCPVRILAGISSARRLLEISTDRRSRPDQTRPGLELRKDALYLPTRRIKNSLRLSGRCCLTCVGLVGLRTPSLAVRLVWSASSLRRRGGEAWVWAVPSGLPLCSPLLPSIGLVRIPSWWWW